MAATVEDKDRRLRQAWSARGWPEQTLERALGRQVRRSRLMRWASDGRWDAEKVEEAVGRHVQMQAGAMTVRRAGWEDSTALVDLYANSPEEVGELEMTVERGPLPFAQFALQDDADIHVVEQSGTLLSAMAHSTWTCWVAEEEVTLNFLSAMRARAGLRGEGLGTAAHKAAWQCPTRSGPGVFYYRRRTKAGKLLATVNMYPARDFGGEGNGVRQAIESDAEQCVELINRTHSGLDLFRVYDAAYLRRRLTSSTLDPADGSDVAIYGWNDYYVVEEAGRIVACGGLWDRGANVRERWRHRRGGTTWTVEPTALMDFGFAEGKEEAMAELIGFFIGRTLGLGRTHLAAPLQWLPAVADRLSYLEPGQDVRAAYIQPGGPQRRTPLRPYTDLAYW